MISTTTTTVVTLTASFFASSFVFMICAMFVTLLIQKEILSETKANRLKQISRVLNVVIIPLALTFLAIAIVEVLKIY